MHFRDAAGPRADQLRQGQVGQHRSVERRAAGDVDSGHADLQDRPERHYITCGRPAAGIRRATTRRSDTRTTTASSRTTRSAHCNAHLNISTPVGTKTDVSTSLNFVDMSTPPRRRHRRVGVARRRCSAIRCSFPPARWRFLPGLPGRRAADVVRQRHRARIGLPAARTMNNQLTQWFTQRAVLQVAAGFAFGIASASIWLHAIAPIHAAFLVVAGGLMVQCGTIWPLRRSLDLRRLWPFLLAGVIGIPIGVWLLAHTDAGMLKVALGAFLRLWRLCAAGAATAARRAPDAAPTLSSASSAAFWAASAAIPACCRRSGRSFAAGRRTWRAPFYQPSCRHHVGPSPCSARWRSTAMGLVLLVLALPALGSAPGSAGALRPARRKRFRQVLAVLLIVSGLIARLLGGYAMQLDPKEVEEARQEALHPRAEDAAARHQARLRARWSRRETDATAAAGARHHGREHRGRRAAPTTCCARTPASRSTTSSIGRGVEVDGAALKQAIRRGCERATREHPLRSSVVHPLTRKNEHTSCGVGVPVIHVDFDDRDETVEIEMIPKGSRLGEQFVAEDGDPGRRRRRDQELRHRLRARLRRQDLPADDRRRRRRRHRRPVRAPGQASRRRGRSARTAPIPKARRSRRELSRGGQPARRRPAGPRRRFDRVRRARRARRDAHHDESGRGEHAVPFGAPARTRDADHAGAASSYGF